MFVIRMRKTRNTAYTYEVWIDGVEHDERDVEQHHQQCGHPKLKQYTNGHSRLKQITIEISMAINNYASVE